ncbi:MAG: aminoglycoside phosphotransferase family protein [Actinomycetota bacterium]|nr:aminoglycoside phosphotransferase family protein [Actinomycetota bacterium]
MHDADAERIHLAVGERPVSLEPARGHGAPSNRRWIARFADGSTAFAKTAAFDDTAEWLRIEHTNHEALAEHAYLPRLLGWHDDGLAPTLVVEDLSHGHWPPPWSTSAIDAVVETLADIHATPLPDRIDEIFERRIWDIREGWGPMRRAPAAALALGVFDAPWLRAHIDELEAAADSAVLVGDTLLHCDVRSDNLCLVGGRALLVDWNWASRGAAVLDLAAWLPSLHHEGGPPPWTLLPGQGPLASLLAGFFLEHAGREPIPQAPHVRQLQLDQGRVALAWACRELGIARPR